MGFIGPNTTIRSVEDNEHHTMPVFPRRRTSAAWLTGHLSPRRLTIKLYYSAATQFKVLVSLLVNLHILYHIWQQQLVTRLIQVIVIIDPFILFPDYWALLCKFWR